METCSLLAIVQAIREMEVQHKHRQTNRTAVQGREQKQSPLQTPWVRGYITLSMTVTVYLFFPSTRTRSSIDNSIFALNIYLYTLAKAQVPNSLTEH